MKTRQERREDGIKRLEALKNETILRYTAEIDYDDDLSLYNVMMSHFAKGDLDDIFLTDVTKGMSDSEKIVLFGLVREFQGLCFSKGDSSYWLDSLEDFPVGDYSLIAYSIFDSYDYLLGLAKEGDRQVLEQLTALRRYEELRDVAMVQFLRNTYIDDRVLTTVLLDMADDNSFYNIFTDEQKGILMNYPEGTIYSYNGGAIKIISPLLLGVQMYNNYSTEYVESIDEANIGSLVVDLTKFFEEQDFDFYDEVLTLSSRYRDYARQNPIILDNEMMDVVYDYDGVDIQEAWNVGDEFLGGTYDTPYTPSSK